MMRRLQLLIAFLIAAFALQAQAPSGYYSSADGLTGDQLKAALHNIIKGHTVKSYDYLWTAYGTTDLRANGTIWDIYSNTNFAYVSGQCGSNQGYQGVGDCYNREHLWAQSWTNSDNTEKTDLHHVFPTDGYVNNIRGNLPFGEVSNPNWSQQYCGKRGPNTVSGYTGIVFEPVDEYKGDIARALMYVSVRYYSEDSGWSTEYDMTNKSVIKDWAITMLLAWHRADPVSPKETARNNAVYGIQGNRNPFIDNPDYAEMIWDPNWQGGGSTNYLVSVEASPDAGGTASLMISGSAGGDASIDFSAQGYSDQEVVESAEIDDNVSVAFNKGTNSNAPKYFNTGTAIRCYGGNYFTVSSTSGNISKVVLTYGSGDGSNAITTNVGTFNTETWTGSASSVTFTINGTSGNRRIKTIAVTYAGSGSSTPAQSATVAAGSSITLSATPNSGYNFVNWTKGGTVISTDATCSVTVNAAGTYVANFAPESCQIAVEATEGGVVNIANAPAPPVQHQTSVTFSQQGFSDAQDVSGVNIKFLDDNVSVKFGKGTGSSSPKYYTSGASVRCYANNSFEISTTTGNIESIAFTFSSYSPSSAITPSVGAFADNSWTGNSSSVTFTLGDSGQRRIQAISVTYETAGSGPVTQATFNYGSTAELTATPNNGYSFVNWTKGGISVSTAPSFNYNVTENSNLVANFTANSVAANTSVTLPSLTLAQNVAFVVNSGATLTVTGNITQPEGSSRSILNGGQLICNNSVYVKMQKSITAWNASTSKGWYAIASPVNGQEFSNVTNLTTATHNIYRYDEVEVEWEEYRDSHNIFNSFENGRGYLFRTANTGGMIEFKGDNNVDAFNYDLSYACDNNNFKGFNLLGNPFTQNITWANLVKANVATDGYYILEESGTNQGKWSLVTLSSATIAPMRAFLVQATGSSPSVIISRTTAKAEDNNDADNIMFAVSNSQHSDEAYVKFKQGHGLNKIEHRNAEIPMLYIIDNDQHFAIADMDDNTNVINLGFEAKTMGQYTLKLKADGDFSCLHLIDRITGEDVDMLIEDEYSFIAAPSDVKNRFVVKCRCNSAANADDDIFAYQNDDDIIIEGNGLLQIFDVTGRIVVNKNVNGVEIIGKPTRSGLYVFRLVGEDVKTQKIVVK